VATTNLEIPVREPEVNRVFGGNGVAVAIKGVVEGGVYAAGQVMVVTVDNGIIDGLGICGNLGGVTRVFDWIDKIEVVCGGRFPMNIAIVAVKTVGESYANTKKYKAQNIGTHM
jgi:hypothetical protein